jgi:hypothetical protein
MQIKTYLDKVVGQSHLLGRWWGNLQTIAQHTNIYIQFLILSFSGVSAYYGISTYLHEHGMALPFWGFVLFVIVSIAALSLFVWRLSIPSTFATWNFQWWNNDNPLKPIVEQLVKDNTEMKQKLDLMNDEFKKMREEFKKTN